MLPPDGASAPGRIQRGPRPTMRTRLHLKPGQKGTKQLLAQYGDRLICVRYRYDPQRKKRLKTVELLVEERDWEPPRPPYADDQIVAVGIAFAEAALRARARQAGGRWNPERKAWELRYRDAVTLKLATRIVKEASSRRYRPQTPRHLRVDAHATSTRRCEHPPLDAGIYESMPTAAAEL